MVVNAYFVTKDGSFEGSLDEWGDITVCGTSYVGYGGTKLSFVDRHGNQHAIRDILVKLDDFPKITDALSENEVEIGSSNAGRKPASSISAELLESLS